MNTISDAYLKQQINLHQNAGYGVASLAFAPHVAEFIKSQDIATVSDYGAGKMRLLEGLQRAGLTEIEYYPYDPVFPEYGPPRPAQLVCCIDVLEHVELDYLERVLDDLQVLTVNLGFFSIHLGPAKKILDDGRNAHLIQQSEGWWLNRLSGRFEILHCQGHTLAGPGIWVLVRALNL